MQKIFAEIGNVFEFSIDFVQNFFPQDWLLVLGKMRLSKLSFCSIRRFIYSTYLSWPKLLKFALQAQKSKVSSSKESENSSSEESPLDKSRRVQISSFFSAIFWLYETQSIKDLIQARQLMWNQLKPDFKVTLLFIRVDQKLERVDIIQLLLLAASTNSADIAAAAKAHFGPKLPR